MNPLAMAWRNVWRNGRRSLVTIAAMTFALWVLILYSGLIEGYLRGMEDDVLELEVGDIQVHSPTYRDAPSIYDVIPDAEDVVRALEAQGLAATTRLIAGGLGASGEQSAGISLRGAHPTRDATVLRLHEHVNEGTWLSADEPKGAVVGRRLAKALAVEVGDELLVLSQGTDGSMANDLLHVRGILGTVSDATDRAAVYIPADTFRELMVIDRGAHQIVIRRPPGSDLEQQLALAVAAAPDLDVQSWRQLLPTVATMLDSSRSMIGIIFFIIYLAVAILVLNAVLMAVFERIKEFGVMKAIGVSPTSVFVIILLETIFQVSIAIVIGVTLALPGMWYLIEHGIDVGTLGGMSVMGMSMRDRWHGIYTASSLAMPILMLVFMSLSAALYPAARAALIRPLDAMRHQ